MQCSYQSELIYAAAKDVVFWCSSRRESDPAAGNIIDCKHAVTLCYCSKIIRERRDYAITGLQKSL